MRCRKALKRVGFRFFLKSPLWCFVRVWLIDKNTLNIEAQGVALFIAVVQLPIKPLSERFQRLSQQ